MIEDYFESVRAIIAASVIVRTYNVSYQQRSEEIGFLRGDLNLIDGSFLHFREFVRQRRNAPAERYTYAYHYQKADGTFIFRYDRAGHFRNLPNFPHHKHINAESSVISSSPPDLAIVLKEIESLIAL